MPACLLSGRLHTSRQQLTREAQVKGVFGSAAMANTSYVHNYWYSSV